MSKRELEQLGKRMLAAQTRRCTQAASLSYGRHEVCRTIHATSKSADSTMR